MSGRILVVDDVEINRRLLTVKLTAEYYQVAEAANGAAAIAHAREHQPDIVLLDVMMPDMDGFETCRRLKADPDTAHIPVVMVTALSEQGDKVSGLSAGADDFLTKPVDSWALATRLRSLLRLKMASDELRRRRATSTGLGLLSRHRPPAEATGGHILVLDDSASGATVQAALTGEGYEVQVAETTSEASAAMASRDFDLVLVNPGPGTGDPLRFCAELRNRDQSRTLPILLVAGHDDRQRLEKAIEIGINDYLTPLIDPAELIARVRTQIRRKQYNDQLRADYQHGLEAALVDELTGAYNRRYLDRHLATQLETAGATTRPVSVMMLDIDHFKSINDTYGHAAGDTVLRELVARMMGAVRDFDTVARYGGEEFAIVLSDVQSETALGIAERVRGLIATTPFPVNQAGHAVTVTISAGIAEAATGETASNLLDRADAALYRAKLGGRNRAVADTPARRPEAALAAI